MELDAMPLASRNDDGSVEYLSHGRSQTGERENNLLAKVMTTSNMHLKKLLN